MIYAEYDFYVNTYGGTLAEDAFEKHISKASAYVDYITMGRITASLLNLHNEKISLAACAVVDALNGEANGGELSSQTVGHWTRTYKGSGKTAEQKKYDNAEVYLLPTGLLYRGSSL